MWARDLIAEAHAIHRLLQFNLATRREEMLEHEQVWKFENARAFPVSSMRTFICVAVTVILIPVVSDNVPEDRNHLRNFYSTLAEHEENLQLFLKNQNLTRIRHRHLERKIQKVRRCRRYAQVYYQGYVPNNCYYSFCRQNYCSYCPTYDCRRRCPYDCQTTTPSPIKGFFFYLRRPVRPTSASFIYIVW